MNLTVNIDDYSLSIDRTTDSTPILWCICFLLVVQPIWGRRRYMITPVCCIVIVLKDISRRQTFHCLALQHFRLSAKAGFTAEKNTTTETFNVDTSATHVHHDGYNFNNWIIEKL
jgi:hypothetical protein